MVLYIRKRKTKELPYVLPACYPEYTPQQPLSHGSFEDYSINWDFWMTQEHLSLDQAIGLLQGYPGNAWHTLSYDPSNKEFIDKLNKVIKSGLSYMLFKKLLIKKVFPRDENPEEKPNHLDKNGDFITEDSVNETSIVKFKDFVEWAFREGFDIPMPLFNYFKLGDLETDSRSDTIKIDTKLFKTALAKIIEADNNPKAKTTIDLSNEKDSWYLRRAVTSRLLSELGFSAKQIYRALCNDNEIPHDAVRHADAWQQKGYEIIKQFILPDNSNLPEMFDISKSSLKPFVEAFKKEKEAWTTLRGVAAYLLNSQLDFGLSDIYLALSKSGKAETDPDAQIRKWIKAGKDFIR